MKSFMEVAKPESGLYACALYSQESKQAISVLQKKLGLKNSISPEKIHTTIVYSRTPVEGFVPATDILEDARLVDIVVWETQYGNTVVGKLHSPYLHDRFKDAMEGGASYDFPDYQPHITLSYSEDHTDAEALKRLVTLPVYLKITGERVGSLRKPSLKELTERICYVDGMWQALNQEKEIIGLYSERADARLAAMNEDYFTYED